MKHCAYFACDLSQNVQENIVATLCQIYSRYLQNLQSSMCLCATTLTQCFHVTRMQYCVPYVFLIFFSATDCMTYVQKRNNEQVNIQQ